jgi:hypothetical protein
MNPSGRKCVPLDTASSRSKAAALTPAMRLAKRDREKLFQVVMPSHVPDSFGMRRRITRRLLPVISMDPERSVSQILASWRSLPHCWALRPSSAHASGWHFYGLRRRSWVTEKCSFSRASVEELLVFLISPNQDLNAAHR